MAIKIKEHLDKKVLNFQVEDNVYFHFMKDIRDALYILIVVVLLVGC